MEDSTPKLSNWDFVAVGCYFAAVIAAGLYAMCRSNRSTVSGYFLAGRFMTWMPVGASLFASNIGSEHFIGLAGSGAAAGIAVGAFELNACFLLQLLGWVFLPVYIASGVCTLPEYMKKRFGGKRIRIYLAMFSLALYIFTKISVNLYSGALFIQQALQWNLYVSVLLLLIATAITTVTGGLAAVIYTDTLQAFVMVAGALVLAVLGFMRIGGYSELYHRYMEAIPNTTLSNVNATCGYPRADSWYMLRDPVGSDMPWVGFLLGQTPASIWYWCTDQMMVQRTLAARSLSHAQGGTLFAGYLKILPVFLLVIPGMMSRVLFTDEVACADPDICFKVCQNRLGCSNIAYPKLVLEIMPIGLKGIMLSVMLAALMSDLTSIFNSASTLFTIDIYGYIRKKAKTRELMIVGRAFVCIMVAIGIGWIPIIQGMQGAQLYIYIQSISAYLAPPIASVYLMAVLWKRANEQGAFWGLMIGLFIGATRMLMDFAYPEPACGTEYDNRPVLVKYVHYMYFAMILFIVTGLSVVIISLFTKKPKPDQIIRTTYWTRFDDRLRYDEKLECQQTNDSYRLKDIKNGIYYEREVMVFSDTEIPNGNGHAGDEVHSGNGCVTEALANGDVENKRVENQVTTLRELPPKKSMLRRGAEWFCGMQSTIETPLSVQEFTDQIHKVTSLKQNPTARLCLYIALAVLFVLDIFLYIFFCTGSDFGLLRGRHRDIFIDNQSGYAWLNLTTTPFV